VRRPLHLALVVVLAIAGLSLMAWPFVDHWRGGAQAAYAQGELRSQLAGSTGATGPSAARRPKPGQPLATLTIPRFGDDWSWVVVEGTGEAELAQGPGHYPATPLPGERGNVGVAAHRAGHGDPFLDFDTLQVGDEVRFSRDGTTWVYTLTSAPEIVPASAVEVLDPTPGRQLTLTTCWPKWGSAKRMFVRAELTTVEG
jgi:sortase A